MFSDIEGSTALLNDLGDAYGDLLDQHDQIMRSAFATHGGYEFSNEGDAFGAAFASPEAAAEAALQMQRRLDQASWPGDERIRVRMGLHLGEPKVRGNDYWGQDVHFAARVCSAAHGGQVIMSAAMRAVVDADQALSLGHHGLKDFPTPRELFQLYAAGDQPEQFPAPRTLSAFRSNLPSISTRLIGREDVIADLTRLFADGERLVTLTGAGGMGKTRVAVRLGEVLSDAFPDGVAFVPLAGIEGGRVFAAVAEATGAPRGGDVQIAVLEHLERRRMLVILDNCEHVVDAAASAVSEILRRSPRVAILATAQIPLDLSAETVRRLPPLATGAAMFLDRARARDDQFDVGDDDRQRIEELCALLEGFPLAIELAAARVRLLGLDRLISALQHDLDALGSGARDLPERHRSLTAAFDWTLSLLSDTEREVFTALGAFATAWTLEEAEQLLAADLDEAAVWEAMTRLMDASLVVVRGDGRFAMPQRVRQYATELLRSSPSGDRRRRQHAEVIGRKLRELALELFVDHRRQFANMVDRLPEAKQAIAWSRAHDPDNLRYLVGLCAPALHHTGELPLVVDAILAFPEPPLSATDYDDAAQSFALGLIHVMQRSTETDTEYRLFDSARKGFERFGDPREALIARHRGIWALSAAGRDREADVLVQAWTAAAAQVPDDRWRTEVLRHAEVGDDANTPGLEHVERTYGLGTGTFSINRAFWRACAAIDDGELVLATGWFGRSLQETPANDLNRILGVAKGFARVLALVGEDEAAQELLTAVHSVYRVLTGADFGNYAPSWGEDFSASAARLDPDLLAAARGRGGAMSYDDLVARALELAQRHGTVVAQGQDQTRATRADPPGGSGTP